MRPGRAGLLFFSLWGILFEVHKPDHDCCYRRSNVMDYVRQARNLLRMARCSQSRMLRATRSPRRHSFSTIDDGRLWYLQPLDIYENAKPYYINLPASALGGFPQSNEVSHLCRGVKIRDLRGCERQFTLERNGFQVFQDAYQGDFISSSTSNDDLKNTQTRTDSWNSETVKKDYYPVIERFLRRRLGAQSTKAFTHEVKSSSSSVSQLTRTITDQCTHRSAEESRRSLLYLEVQGALLSRSKAFMSVRSQPRKSTID